MDETQSTTQSAPVLRLSYDIWSLLSECLDFGDVLRLVATGNRAFTDRVRLGVRILKLSWVSSRYIELDHVFEVASTFKNMLSFDFCEPRNKLLFWTPISWSSLSPNLVSLSLSFQGAPSSVLLPGLCGSMWPQLLHLTLIESFKEIFSERSDPHEIDLSGLPPSLQRLCVVSTRGLRMDPSHLSLLPPNLEELALDYPLYFIHTSASNTEARVTLPSLPSTIKKLMLRDGNTDHWLINFAGLPAALESFKFESTIYAAYHADQPDNGDARVSMEGAAAHLPYLVELEMSCVRISVASAVRLVPPSVTRLSLWFKESSPEDLALIVTHFGHRITKQPRGWEELDEKILNGENDFPLLESFALKRLIPGSPHIIPKNLKSFRVPPQFDGSVPLSVTQFSHEWSHGDPPQCHLDITPQHKITSLILNARFQETWLYKLPNTLESLQAQFEEEVWFEMVRFMSEPCQLPNLCRITVDEEKPLRWLIQLPLPPQLARFKIELTDLLGEHLNASHLSNLRSSSLEKLSLTFHGKTQRNPIGFFDLLNDLPSNLKTLKLSANYIPSVQWPVILPSKLTNLEVSTRDWHAPRHLEEWLADIRSREETRSSPFKLPDSLTRYSCYCKPTLPLESLPPNLSAYFIHDQRPRQHYYATRVPPSPSMKLSLSESPSSEGHPSDDSDDEDGAET